MITKIIKEQALVIGPLAWMEAGKVKGIHIVDQTKGEVSIEDWEGGGIVVDNLISQYERIFGRASREVCKEAVTSLIADLAPAEVPLSLK